MNKRKIVAFLLLSVGVILFFAIFLFVFGKPKFIKNGSVTMKYNESPLYREKLHDSSIVYLNIWASYSPDSIERAKGLQKNKTDRIVYNISIDTDSITIQKAISKYGIENDVTIENYDFREQIIKELYKNKTFSTKIVTIQNYRIPKTFILKKDSILDSF